MVPGTETRFNCGKLGAGWTCQAQEKNGSSSLIYGPVDKECTIETEETCSGGIIHNCDLGHQAEFDCKSAGFSGCMTTTAAAAACVK